MTSTMLTRDVAQIRQLITAKETLMRTKDANGLVSRYAPEIFQYDLAPPLQHSGPAVLDPSGVQCWFSTFEGPLDYEVRDLAVTAGEDVAFCTSLERLTATPLGSSESFTLWTDPSRRPSTSSARPHGQAAGTRTTPRGCDRNRQTPTKGSAMFEHTKAFSGFSVDDIPAAKRFYGETLGLRVSEEYGMLTLHIAGDRDTLIYPKEDHAPATFTILNFPVDDIASAVRQLAERGIRFEAGEGIDDDGIMRQGGPLIAWFKDPAGNFLSVLQAD